MGMRMHIGCPLVAVRADVPAIRLTIYELLRKLDDEGWSCVVVDSREALARAKASPHEPADGQMPKV